MSHSLNFLHRAEPKAQQRQHKRRRILRTLFVSILILVLAWTVCLVVVTSQVFAHVSDARDQLLVAKDEAQAFSFERARETLSGAQENLSMAERRLPILVTVAWIPRVGTYVASISELIQTSSAIAVALDPLFDLGQDMMQLAGISQEYLDSVQSGLSPEVTFDDLSTETKRAVLARLAASADEIDLLIAQISIAQEEIDLLAGAAALDPVVSMLDPVREQLSLLEEQLDLLAIGARLLPAYAGLQESSTNLLLFLNNDEIRPGGGFIGSYGVLEVDGGDIEHMETADVYTLDNAVAEQVVAEPPTPLKEYNAATQWFFRDSNWSPDFSLSTQKGIELFLQEAGYLEEGSGVPHTDQVDHVMAFTPTFASKLLEVTGSIDVGGQTFTAENVADALEYQVQFGFKAEGIPVSQRKEILADLIDEMKSRLYQLSYDQWETVFVYAREALETKQFLLFSTDEQVQEVIERVGWGGTVEPGEVDTLLVVDANLAALKTDPVVERSIEYAVGRNSLGQWVGEVAITYNHTGTFDYKTTRYRTYTRVYVPEGSELLGASTETDVVGELGLTSFGGFLSVEPGQTGSLSFTFLLSDTVVAAIENGAYVLDVFKQAGALDHALTLDLDFGKQVTHADPAEASEQWGDDRYRLNTILDQDKEIHVEL